MQSLIYIQYATVISEYGIVILSAIRRLADEAEGSAFFSIKINRMKSSESKPKWKKQYLFVALLGIAYIILLGLFTWYFNYSF